MILKRTKIKFFVLFLWRMVLALIQVLAGIMASERGSAGTNGSGSPAIVFRIEDRSNFFRSSSLYLMLKILFFFLFSPGILPDPQLLSMNTDLKEIITHEERIKDFLISKSVLVSADATMSTPSTLDIYLYNRSFNNGKESYTLFGLPVENIYGYHDGANKIALYVLMNINDNELNLFANELGMPWNVSEKDFDDKDFDMLLWDVKGLHISMLNNYKDSNNSTENKIC